MVCTCPVHANGSVGEGKFLCVGWWPQGKRVGSRLKRTWMKLVRIYLKIATYLMNWPRVDWNGEIEFMQLIPTEFGQGLDDGFYFHFQMFFCSMWYAVSRLFKKVFYQLHNDRCYVMCNCISLWHIRNFGFSWYKTTSLNHIKASPMLHHRDVIRKIK